MINHGRTLLLNVAGGTRPSPNFPGEEIIPPNFTPRRLSGGLATVQQIMFGTSPDRLMLNYRARQLLSTVHGIPELEQFLLDLDSRITYWPTSNMSLFQSAFGESIMQIAGANQIEIDLVGDPLPPDSGGRLQREWRIDVLDGDTVRIKQQKPVLSTVTAEYGLTDGISNLIDLPGSGFQFRFHTPDIGTAWIIESNVRPPEDLSVIVTALENAGEPNIIEVLGTGNNEPFLTLRNLWNREERLGWRLGAFVVAYILRVNEAPQQQAA